MPNYAQGWEVDPITGQARTQQSTDSYGIQSPNATTGVIADPLSYGGYRATARPQLGGTLTVDPASSGQRQAVSRYQGLAEAAAARDSYRADYSEANSAEQAARKARMGNAAGYGQERAMSGLAAAAAGRAPSATDSLRQSALDSSLQQALSASAGTRGMAATAAAQQQAYERMAAQGATGASSMAAMRAGEMSQARDAYTAGGQQMRGQDLRSLGMAEQRAITQLDSDLAQRQLNQQRQMDYENLALGVNQATLNQASSIRELRAGIYDNALKARTDDAAAQARNQAALIGAFGTGGASLASLAARQGGSGGGGDIDRRNPYGGG